MNIRSFKKQAGLTAISWVIILAFLGFQGVMAMNIGLVYLDDSSVKSIMSNLETDPTARGLDKKNLRKLIVKRLKINNIYSIKKDHIKIKKGKGGWHVVIEYEPRGKLFGTLDFIVTFKHEANVISSGG